MVRWCLDLLRRSGKLDFAKNIKFWSDCGPHFRCQESIYNFLALPLVERDKWLSVDVNFFGEGHGKSLCDTCFSVLSRWLKEAENIKDIHDTVGLKAAWEECAKGQENRYTFLPLLNDASHAIPEEKIVLCLTGKVKTTHSIRSVLVPQPSGEAKLAVSAKALTCNTHAEPISWKLKSSQYQKEAVKTASIIDRDVKIFGSNKVKQLLNTQRVFDALQEQSGPIRVQKSKKRARDEADGEQEQRPSPDKKQRSSPSRGRKRSRQQIEDDSEGDNAVVESSDGEDEEEDGDFEVAGNEEDGDYVPPAKRFKTNDGATVAPPRTSLRQQKRKNLPDSEVDGSGHHLSSDEEMSGGL